MSRFLDNKKFAFTIFDDTDDSTVENYLPVYSLLTDLGFRVTKSVWALENVPTARYKGGTLQDREYLRFVLALKSKGHEIALHNVRNFDAARAVVERGLAEFESRIGERPRAHANHSGNRDNLYWGPARLTNPVIRTFYNCATRFKHDGSFEGHVPGSDYFWGDICRERIDYVRNFVVGEINLDRVNPSMPYHNPAKPFVNLWFSSSEGRTVESFCDTIAETHQDRLEQEGGVCIMYTHFACGFSNGKLHPRFETLMRRLASKNGWFVPVSTLLDHMKGGRGRQTIPPGELASLERRWLAYKLRKGHS